MISITLKSFEQLGVKYNIFSIDFFQYLQIWHFTESLLQQDKLYFKMYQNWKKPWFLSILLKRLILSIIIYCSTLTSYNSLKLLCEWDLRVSLRPADWTKICNGIFPKCTSISLHEQNSDFFIGSILHFFDFIECSLVAQTFVLNIRQSRAYIILFPSFYLLNYFWKDFWCRQ